MRDARGGLRLVRILDDHRALGMLILVGGALALLAPGFLSVHNLTTILKGASLTGIVAIGFTLILILRQLDLSIGAVVMLSGLLVIGLQPELGWTGSALVAVAAGAAVGVVNGLLVVKARIDSFIVTLSTMTIVTGVMHLYSKGGSKAIDDYAVADWLERPLLPLLPPMVILTLLLVAGGSCFLNRTVIGRGFFVVGANPETAWRAGLNRDRYLLAGFVLCSTLAAVGGVVFAANLSSMTSAAALGTRTLMTTLAAVIIGGTVMTGGKGSVVKSFLAVLLLTTLFNGIGCFGFGFEVQIFVNGLILAVVVLFEAYAMHHRDLHRGQRPDLVEEWDRDIGRIAGATRARRGGVMIASAVVGLGIVLAVFLRPAEPIGDDEGAGAPDIDMLSLRGTDGQPLILAGSAPRTVPPRPAAPEALPETDPGHWWPIEFAGWTVEKVPQPPSPGDGPAGKRVILLKAGDHPYWTAYVHGFETLAAAHGMRTKIFNSNWNVDLQAQQTDQAINERPDLVIFAPVDATACTPLLRKLNLAGIPCITSNTIPCDEAMRYCLAWTGPDDWGQFRMLARHFADALERKGGYAIIRHMPGSSPFFARTYAPITELAQYAPAMELLAMDTANLEAEGTMQLVSAWLTKYGDELQGLVLAGDGFSMTGTLEAIERAGRDDLLIIAAGNSKTGMDSVAAGDALAITYQSAEGDGALAVHTAARWFAGEEIAPVVYLPRHVITRNDVARYMPAQW